MNYEEVQALMKTHHDNVAGKRGVLAKVRSDKKLICNKTYLLKRDDYYTLSLFNNEIIVWHPTAVYLHDCSWFSRTTFDRWNTYLPRGFSIHGERTPYKHGVIAFVKTPDGTYPYSSGVAFTYEGKQFATDAESWDTNQALPVYRALPAYITEYIDRLFGRQLDHKLPHLGGSNSTASRILSMEYPAKLLNEMPSILNNQRALAALVHCGACGIRRAKNKQEEALHAELTLGTGITLAEIAMNAQQVRAQLRRGLTERLIKNLGFSFNEWNRR
jgi:hypothetical protein